MDNREKLERRYLELKAQYGSKVYGKVWKPSASLSVRVEFEQIVKSLTK